MAKIEKGKIFVASEAIGYAEDGVVSKEFINRDIQLMASNALRENG